MGPPALTGGWGFTITDKNQNTGLQWGRRLSPADGADEATFRRQMLELQWGRRLSPADGLGAT